MTDGRDFVYAIAGGDTLDLINYLHDEARKSKEKVAELAQQAGATVAFQEAAKKGIRDDDDAHPGYPVFDFGDKKLPQDWKSNSDKAFMYEMLDMKAPNTAFPSGEEASNIVDTYIKNNTLQRKFNSFCDALTDEQHSFIGYKYNFEKIGDQFIVKCPPHDNDPSHFVVPAGCTPIAYEEYLALSKATNPPAARTIEVCKRQFKNLNPRMRDYI